MNTNLIALSLISVSISCFSLTAKAELRHDPSVGSMFTSEEVAQPVVEEQQFYMEIENARWIGDFHRAFGLAEQRLNYYRAIGNETWVEWYENLVEVIRITVLYREDLSRMDYKSAANNARRLVRGFETLRWQSGEDHYRQRVSYWEHQAWIADFVRVLDSDWRAPDYAQAAANSAEQYLKEFDDGSSKFSGVRFLPVAMRRSTATGSGSAGMLVTFWNELNRISGIESIIFDAAMDLRQRLAESLNEAYKDEVLRNFPTKVEHLKDFERGNRGSVIKLEAKEFGEISKALTAFKNQFFPAALRTQAQNRPHHHRFGKRPAANGKKSQESTDAYQRRVLAELQANRHLDMYLAYEEKQRLIEEAKEAEAQRKTDLIHRKARQYIGGIFAGTVSIK